MKVEEMEIEAPERESNVKAPNLMRAEIAEERKRSDVSKAKGGLRDWKGIFAQPAFEEVSRLTFGKLGGLRVYAQEARNHFAHLLNRGSRME